jgi:ethanolamine utilization protein EutN
MKRGTVRGTIVATKRLWQAPQGALLKIQLDDDDGGGYLSGGYLIALDTLGCGNGERVLVADGSAAAALFQGKQVPVDALIIAAIEKE